MIAIVIVVVWLNNRERHLAIEQELAQLNSPSSLDQTSPQMPSVGLSPGAVRGTERQPDINTSVDVPVVELRLPWVRREQYSSYHAEIRRVADDESFKFPDLQARSDRGNVLRVRVPAHMLTRGQYQIRLSGINPDGTSGLMEEYLFTVNQ
jgi:hypothetical protein